ncbi:MAG: biotin synthase BioB, partial [Nitrospinota bacterium]
MMDYPRLARRALADEAPSREEADAVIDAPDEDLLPILHAAFQVRRRHFGRKVQIHLLVNAKSGLCPEDCAYCSQSAVSTAPIEKYGLMDEAALLDGAKRAVEAKSRRYCIVLSGRGPTDEEIARLGAAVRRIKSTYDISVCCSVGILDAEKAKRLRAAGVNRLNHNLNTSQRFYPEICSTHTYRDRIETLHAARGGGLELCSGVIFGQGETNDDVYDLCRALRELRPESIPVNFLHAIGGTPLEDVPRLGPARSLRLLSLVRFFNPRSEIRVAGGREVQLGTLQPLALYPANSIFVSGYLTTPGQPPDEAHRMIREMGFEVDATGESDPHPFESAHEPT